MITTSTIDQFGRLIKAAAQKFSLATTNEQEARRFIDEWPTAAAVLTDYEKIRTEIEANRGIAGGKKKKWDHYQNEISARLLVPSDQLRRLCASYFKEITDDLLDSETSERSPSPLEIVAAEVETTMQRLIARSILALSKKTNHEATSPGAQIEWCRERGVSYNDYIISPAEQSPIMPEQALDVVVPVDVDVITESPPTPPAINSQGLDKRHRILIHFYEGGKMVARKHKDYDDYNQFCTTQKRLNYPNNSEHKLRPLIKDIEQTLPYLSVKARQDADLELNTLKLRLTVEK